MTGPVAFLDTVRYISSKEKIECVSYLSPEDHAAEVRTHHDKPRKSKRKGNETRVTFREDMSVVEEERSTCAEVFHDYDSRGGPAADSPDIEEVTTTKIVYKTKRVVSRPDRRLSPGKNAENFPGKKSNAKYPSNDVFFQSFVKLGNPDRKINVSPKLILPPKRAFALAEDQKDRSKSSSPQGVGKHGVKRDLRVLKPTGNATLDRQYSSACDILPTDSTNATIHENKLFGISSKKERLSTRSNFSFTELTERASFVRQKSFLEDEFAGERSHGHKNQPTGKSTTKHEKITAHDVKKFRMQRLKRPSILPSISQANLKLPPPGPSYAQRQSKFT